MKMVIVLLVLGVVVLLFTALLPGIQINIHFRGKQKH
jgi:hypothetical protein